MRVIIIFPEKFFTKEQLKKLNKHDVKFIEGGYIDLDKIDDLYKEDEFIFAINPAYVKGLMKCLPMVRIKKMRGLKGLCLGTTSFSWVNTEELKKMDIVVTNTPGKSTNAVAEFNIFMMYSLLRKTPILIKEGWEMRYDDSMLNFEAFGLTAGIVGLGAIGSRVGELCQGNGMEVCYWNRSKKNSTFQSVNLEELFRRVDVVFNTIATPPKLKGFLNKDLLSKLKESAVIVSTSDTHVFDDKYILDKVAKGKLGGYAFESNEKKITDFKGNVMVFPEQAFYTFGTQKKTARLLTESILSIIKGDPLHRVN